MYEDEHVLALSILLKVIMFCVSRHYVCWYPLGIFRGWTGFKTRAVSPMVLIEFCFKIELSALCSILFTTHMVCMYDMLCVRQGTCRRGASYVCSRN